jgi:hypothetical protein
MDMLKRLASLCAAIGFALGVGTPAVAGIEEAVDRTISNTFVVFGTDRQVHTVQINYRLYGYLDVTQSGRSASATHWRDSRQCHVSQAYSLNRYVGDSYDGAPLSGIFDSSLRFESFETDLNDALSEIIGEVALMALQFKDLVDAFDEFGDFSDDWRFLPAEVFFGLTELTWDVITADTWARFLGLRKVNCGEIRPRIDAHRGKYGAQLANALVKLRRVDGCAAVPLIHQNWSTQDSNGRRHRALFVRPVGPWAKDCAFASTFEQGQVLRGLREAVPFAEAPETIGALIAEGSEFEDLYDAVFSPASPQVMGAILTEYRALREDLVRDTPTISALLDTAQDGDDLFQLFNRVGMFCDRSVGNFVIMPLVPDPEVQDRIYELYTPLAQRRNGLENAMGRYRGYLAFSTDPASRQYEALLDQVDEELRTAWEPFYQITRRNASPSACYMLQDDVSGRFTAILEAGEMTPELWQELRDIVNGPLINPGQDWNALNAAGITDSADLDALGLSGFVDQMVPDAAVGALVQEIVLAPNGLGLQALENAVPQDLNIEVLEQGMKQLQSMPATLSGN